ncbi:hypothetical protein OCU04_012429 [Sclerotinia nivalis]|uniref:Uncharacterized protein n=1 Tax=Sclerotinia nivalis TaxID=352851 RepID=A0A9X0DEV6_9HELO|nr:hypothetical protein OCU04_012429 [Sclerotinia nivalis]
MIEKIRIRIRVPKSPTNHTINSNHYHPLTKGFQLVPPLHQYSVNQTVQNQILRIGSVITPKDPFIQKFDTRQDYLYNDVSTVVLEDNLEAQGIRRRVTYQAQWEKRKEKKRESVLHARIDTVRIQHQINMVTLLACVT